MFIYIFPANSRQFDEEFLAECELLAAVLRKLAHFKMTQMVPSLFERLPLVHWGPAGDAPRLSGKLYLRSCSMKNPSIGKYVPCAAARADVAADAEIQNGLLLKPALELETYLKSSTLKMALMAVAKEERMRLYLIHYTWVHGPLLQVCGLEDISESIHTVRTRNKKTEVEKQADAIMEMIAPSKAKKPQAPECPDPPDPRRRRRAPVEDPAESGSGESEEEGGEEEASVTSSDDDGGDGSADGTSEEEGSAEEPEEEEELGDETSSDAEGVAEWRAAVDLSLLPRFVFDTGYVEDRATGQIIGSIRTYHQGEARERISLYCRLHGCQPPPQPFLSAPPHHKMLEWFKGGLDMPRGKEHRAAHLAKWREIRG